MKKLISSLTLWVIISCSVLGTEITPGMKISEVKSQLAKQGIEVSNQYQLSIMPSDKNTILEFCNIDENITLVIAYDKTTLLITGLSLYFIPDDRTSKTQVVAREATKVIFSEKDQFTFTIKKQ